MTAPTETIVAIATAAGRGGVGVVRVSGPRVVQIATALLERLPPPRYASYGAFHDAHAQAIDHGLTLYFPAPASFTGEDVLELHAHGSPVVLEEIVQRVVALGARRARPGEFSERAFLNGKIDLVQAEAIADLITATTQQAARAAQRSLQGEFSQQVGVLVAALVQLRVYVEATIDFADEEIELLATGHIAQRLETLRAQLAALQVRARQGQLLREGMTVVIAGRPNVGKSSLLNRLAARDTAIVTDIPGTTRDILREHINLDGLPVQVLDTAGLREATDAVEQIGIARAWGEIERADRLLWVIDDSDPAPPDLAELGERLRACAPLTVVRNKIDTSGRPVGVSEGSWGVQVAVSARTGAGMDELRVHLKASMGYSGQSGDHFSARARHLDALRRAQAIVDTAISQFGSHVAIELLAEDLRAAQDALGEITGAVTSDELLGRIFGEFCIGK